MIWFFDSWFWGLQTMKHFYQQHPEYDYIFLADTANCPYWQKTWKEIKKLTFNALQWLFNQWAEIVIIACNTAAAYSIRERQTQFPNKKALSISIPGVEKILEKNDISWKIWIIATQATVDSDIYNDLFKKFGGETDPKFNFVIASELVDLVEKWFENEQENLFLVRKFTKKLPQTTQYLILWCTHFPILKKYFKQTFNGKLIDPSEEAARKFWTYLNNHPEIKKKLKTNKQIKFFTTGNTSRFNTIGSKIRWNKIQAKKAKT
jgi:glutamate racemase